MPVDVVTTVAPVASVVKATVARVVTVVLVAVVATTVAATPAAVLPAATTLVLVAMAPPLVVQLVPLAARVARTKPTNFASFAAWVNEAKCSAVRPSLLQNTLFI